MTRRRRACRTGKSSWRSKEQAKRVLTIIRQNGEQRDLNDEHTAFAALGHDVRRILSDLPLAGKQVAMV